MRRISVMIDVHCTLTSGSGYGTRRISNACRMVIACLAVPLQRLTVPHVKLRPYAWNRVLP
jgi:hypothetical protein